MLDAIESKLEELITSHPATLPYSHLFSAAKYSLLAKAKRLRPQLLLTTAALYDVPQEIALQPACALEFLHTYSLIHDDLPCMDNDDFRRGNPSLHKVYPESHALLTGDYLLTTAFELLATSPSLTDTQRVDLITTLATHAGAHGIIGGQVMDLKGEENPTDWNTIELMHRCKTASLLTAALLQQIGNKSGISFQLIDDLLDITSSLQQMGKQAGSDQANNKRTALSLFTPTECKAKAEELHLEALHLLSQLSRPAPQLATLLGKLTTRLC